MFTKKIMAVILSIVMLIGTAAGFASAKEFNDVKEDSWFKAAVDYVVERGLFNGTGKGNFSPNKQASKGMIITVLARMAGTDVDTGATDGNYSDVDYSLWYGPAIAWAYRMGIISDERKFEPNSMLTRENMAVIIANFIDAFDLTYEEKTSEEPQYTDYDKISEEAKDAVALTYKAGIFKGNKNGTFKPQSGLTRAELATVIMRLAKLTEESGEVSGIAFDRKTVKVTVDDTVKAAVNAVPKEIENVSYTYTSADTNIATVDEEGNIKGIAVGETVITAAAPTGKTAEITVVVCPKATGIELDKTEVELFAGETVTLTAVLSPDTAIQPVNWMSSDTAIAEVENGTVTAVAEGEAEITAYIDDNVKAVCKVTVKGIAPEEVKLSTEELTVTVGAFKELTVEMYPEDAVNTADWTVENEDIAKYENGKVYGLAVGETTVTVTTVNGLTASCKVIVEEPKPASFSVDSWRLSVWAKQYNTKAAAILKQRYANNKFEDTLYITAGVYGFDDNQYIDMLHGSIMEDDKAPKEYWDESTTDGYPYFEDKILITDDELNNETPGYDGKYRFTSSDESIVKINEYTGRIYMVATIDLKINPDDSCEFIPVNKTCRITVTNIEDDTSITLNVVLDIRPFYIQSDPNYKARYCAEMFRLVNEKRVENGLPELEYYFAGQERADQRAYNISKDFTHQHSGSEVMLKTGVGYRIYKDIHITQWSPEEAAKDDFDMWMNSDAHRKILVESYTSASHDKYFVCSFCWPHGTRYAIANIYTEWAITH